MTFDYSMVRSLASEHSFHHIGYATVSLERERAFFQSLGYTQEGVEFVDPCQGVRGLFLHGPGPRIELLENLPGSSTLTPFLKLGIRMYHLAYEVSDLSEAIGWARQQRGRMTVSPIPAVAFSGRSICFFAFRQGLMVELIERKYVGRS